MRQFQLKMKLDWKNLKYYLVAINTCRTNSKAKNAIL